VLGGRKLRFLNVYLSFFFTKFEKEICSGYMDEFANLAQIYILGKKIKQNMQNTF
jgi:hypothetical protein